MSPPMVPPLPITIRYEAIDKKLYWKACQAASKSRAQQASIPLFFRIIIWIVLVGLIVRAFEVPLVRQGGPAFLAGIFLLYVAIFIFSILQKQRLGRILDEDQKARGPTSATFGPAGCDFSSSFGDTHLNWRACDTVLDLGNATGLRSGLVVYPLPDVALPADITPDQFRKTLETWRTA